MEKVSADLETLWAGITSHLSAVYLVSPSNILLLLIRLSVRLFSVAVNANRACDIYGLFSSTGGGGKMIPTAPLSNGGMYDKKPAPSLI